MDHADASMREVVSNAVMSMKRSKHALRAHLWGLRVAEHVMAGCVGREWTDSYQDDVPWVAERTRWHCSESGHNEAATERSTVETCARSEWMASWVRSVVRWTDVTETEEALRELYSNLGVDGNVLDELIRLKTEALPILYQLENY